MRLPAMRRLTLVAVAAALSYPAWWLTAYPRGMAVALLHTTFGHYEIKIYGYPHPSRWECARLLRERYGVEVRAEAGCVVTQSLVWYVDGYNGVSESRLIRRFGKDIFQECWADGYEDYKRRLKDTPSDQLD